MALPSTPIPETGYRPISARPTYQLAVLENAERLQVAEPRMVGRLQQATADRLSYDIVQGTFAGGRIVLWRGQSGELQAELTIYGSGLPVVKSERGPVRIVSRAPGGGE
ncbi:MAG TPA: hypothetical protein VE869_00685 [Gemmatimonas sp.]|nr:hypothetical protein [Gemmatimonas sp.]